MLINKFLTAGRTDNLPPIGVTPDIANSWVSKIASELRLYMGHPVERLSRNYCGKTKTECRSLIATALTKAADAAKKQYGNDIEKWQIPTTCDAGCRQIKFFPTGDILAEPRHLHPGDYRQLIACIGTRQCHFAHLSVIQIRSIVVSPVLPDSCCTLASTASLQPTEPVFENGEGGSCTPPRRADQMPPLM